jgi:hypothetical protein
MEPVKIVARFIDREIKKSFSQDFFPNKPVFHIHNDPLDLAKSKARSH